MADVAMWQDKVVRTAFEAKARARLDEDAELAAIRDAISLGTRQ